MDEKPRIAFIGIGLMGSRMATRLLNAGYSVTVRNRSPGKCQPLAALGGRVATSVADAVKDADIVLTSLAGADAIEAVFFGADGVVSAAPEGCLTIDLSSVAPDIARENHRRLAEAGYAHLDAPVSGGVSGAEEGTLAILVGGTAEYVDRARPVLDVLGNIFHLGEEGAGQVVKLVNQTIVHVFIGGVTEGLMLAAALGVDADKAREALLGGYCQSRILTIQGEKMVKRDFVPGGPLKYSVKDLNMSVEMARDASLELPLAKKTLEQYQNMVESGQGNLDHSALLLAYERENTPIRVSPEKQDKLP
ncbi:MAG: NAD(P)-dependent oxidoreductase [Gammaproteobacteria bacterium]|nr:NAD(P)-dependent oxidoreductase [Gammaproteobacteria bacterium]